MFRPSKCSCRICRLRSTISARVIDAVFRDIVLSSYGADVARVWKREGVQ